MFHSYKSTLKNSSWVVQYIVGFKAILDERLASSQPWTRIEFRTASNLSMLMWHHVSHAEKQVN